MRHLALAPLVVASTLLIASVASSAAPSPARVTSTDGAWVQLPPPGVRHFHSAICDPLRNRVVIFAGNDGPSLNDVWVMSLSGTLPWSKLPVAGTPPPERYWHSAIYDPIRDRMLVFGGQGPLGLLSDVWALSLSGIPTWTQLSPSGAPPSARNSHTAIYDPVRDRMLVFGGFDGIHALNEVWALSLAGTPTWMQLTPSGTPPGPHYFHSAIYDPLRDRMVIFGGADGTNDVNDVWALSLAGTPAWLQITPAGTPPSARYSHSAIYDPTNDRMVVFGGNGSTGVLNDLWTLSLGSSPTWTQAAPAGTPPSARSGHTAIYDPSGNRMIVFAGATGNTAIFNDTWSLSLGASPAWSRPGAPEPPGAREVHTAIFDPVRGRMIVFGGYCQGAPANDLWALSLGAAQTWTQLSPAGTPPSPRSYPSLIYDPVRDRLVVFGGTNGTTYFNDVWTLSLAGAPTWTQLFPTGALVSPRVGHTAIYDPVGDRMVIFGGNNSLTGARNDVLALSLSGSPAWTLLAPSGPVTPTRTLHTAIDDPIRQRMIVFGGASGIGDANDVWALSLSGSPAWTQLAPGGTPPSGRETHSAIYDSARDRMVVFAGRGMTGENNDVWALALAGGTAWTQLAPSGITPGAHYEHSAIYDPSYDRMVVFGGVAGGAVNDVWDLNWSDALGVSREAAGDELWLSPASPNPSRFDVPISFVIPRAGQATVRVYDVSGRAVRTLLDGPVAAGAHSVRWDRRVASGALAEPGLYFYELRVAGRQLARRVVLIQ
ncbi:MAG: Kelch repeat-containing protein [Candidatus Eiseniibacteriota bacterium]